MKLSAKKLSVALLISLLASSVVSAVLAIRLFDETNQRQAVSLDIFNANTLISRMSTALGMADPSSTLRSLRAISGSLSTLQRVRKLAIDNGWDELIKALNEADDILKDYKKTYEVESNIEYQNLLHNQLMLQFNLLTERLSVTSASYSKQTAEQAQRSYTIIAMLAIWTVGMVLFAAALFYSKVIRPIIQAETALTSNNHDALVSLKDNSSVELNALFSALLSSRADLQHQATHDYLTGLANRFFLNQALEYTLKISKRERLRFSILMFDLDNFKDINDSLGHEAGDGLLQQVSDRVKANLRESDIFARLGGDEFCIFSWCPENAEVAQQALVISRKVQDAFAEPFALETQVVNITASIGIATYPKDGDSAVDLLRNADAAMYKAKGQGKSAAAFYSIDLTLQAEERLRIESELMVALREQQFFLEFQLKYNLQKQCYCGVEALIRWRHPERGLVPPNDFIPVAERSWLIESIDDWVLNEALKTLAQWQRAGAPMPIVSVNLSASRFKRHDLAQQIENLLQEHTIAADKLCLEITEYSFLDAEPQVMDNLLTLRQLGVMISLDDFGTGYSSLSKLRTLPVDEIKIDRSFVRDIDQDTEAADVLKSLLGLCQSLSFQVVAEGVENKAQLEILESLNCDAIQGFYIARPESADKVTVLLAESCA